MRAISHRGVLRASLMLSTVLLAGPVLAQEAEAPPGVASASQQPTDVLPDDDKSDIQGTNAEGAQGAIVVTGSRIRQDAFTSPTPIQVIDTAEAKKAGIVSVQDLLQRQPVASGTQIDATLNTSAGTSNGTEAPPTGGTGSSNIDLRGLGQERTLVLINGRRLGSAGARGAPAQPDISLLPLGLIERIEVLTEGASSIYGADAVAGVVNVILKNDFEGFEFSGSIQRPEADGGDIENISAVIGASGDRARIMAGVDYYNREIVLAGQRDYANSSRYIATGPDGTVYSVERNGLFDNIIYDISGTQSTAPGYADIFPLLFYTPGSTNIGVPNFSDYRALPTPSDPNQRDQCTRGLARCYGNFVYQDQYNEQDELRASPLIQPLRRYSFASTGSYDLNPEGTAQAYFEAYYFNRKQDFYATTEQIFPDVPGEIPVVDANGFATRDGNGDVIYVDNPFNPFSGDVEPIISLSDPGQRLNLEVQQHRLVGGVRGEIPGDWFKARNWTFDAYWSYDRSTGFISSPVINEMALYNATQGVYAQSDGAGGYTYGCGPIDRIGGGFLSLPNCVPVNLFASSIYATGDGRNDGTFATQAERDYLVGNRTNRTAVTQTIYSASITGDLFKLPWSSGGTVAFAAGFEHRDDSIDSQNSLVGVQGLNAAENPTQEGETRGKRQLNEVYGEISIPLIADMPFVDTLSIDGAFRYVDESNFGDDLTYRARALYRPVRWVQISGSYGTSYRAPNLREQFLAPQAGGIGGQNDPCININIQGAITAAGSDADAGVQNLIANCVADGVPFTDADNNGRLDTTVLGTAGVTTIPVFNGGNANLEPETSRSYTATVAVSPPLGSTVRLDLSAAYYDIRVESAVNELDAVTIINKCYRDQAFPNLSSPFCSQISRPTTGNVPSRIINGVNSGFVNTGFETVKGFDFTGRARIQLQDLVGWNAQLSVGATATLTTERKFQVLPEQPVIELKGTFGYPKWKVQPTVGLTVGAFEFLAQGRYIGPQQLRADQALTGSTTVINCGGCTVIPVQAVKSIYYQDASISYDFDTFSLTFGVTNLFDQDPHLISNNAPFQRNNAFTGSGYDFFGRTYFLNGTVKF